MSRRTFSKALRFYKPDGAGGWISENEQGFEFSFDYLGLINVYHNGKYLDQLDAYASNIPRLILLLAEAHFEIENARWWNLWKFWLFFFRAKRRGVK